MEGYYDHAPRVRLVRHVAVIGWWSELTRAAAYRAAALLGLPFEDLDRLVEHEAGQGLGPLVLDRGESAYRAIERRSLERIVGQAPPAILALGDGALLDADNRRLVRGACRLVVLELDPAGLYWRIRSACRGRGGDYWHPLIAGSPRSVDEIRGYYRDRQPGFADADARLDVRGLSGAQAGRLLEEWIVSVSPAA